jgi:hypothetical protein
MRFQFCDYLLRDRHGVHPFEPEDLANPSLG